MPVTTRSPAPARQESGQTIGDDDKKSKAEPWSKRQQRILIYYREIASTQSKHEDIAAIVDRGNQACRIELCRLKKKENQWLMDKLLARIKFDYDVLADIAGLYYDPPEHEKPKSKQKRSNAGRVSKAGRVTKPGTGLKAVKGQRGRHAAATRSQSLPPAAKPKILSSPVPGPTLISPALIDASIKALPVFRPGNLPPAKPTLPRPSGISADEMSPEHRLGTPVSGPGVLASSAAFQSAAEDVDGCRRFRQFTHDVLGHHALSILAAAAATSELDQLSRRRRQIGLSSVPSADMSPPRVDTDSSVTISRPVTPQARDGVSQVSSCSASSQRPLRRSRRRAQADVSMPALSTIAAPSAQDAADLLLNFGRAGSIANGPASQTGQSRQRSSSSSIYDLLN